MKLNYRRFGRRFIIIDCIHVKEGVWGLRPQKPEGFSISSTIKCANIALLVLARGKGARHWATANEMAIF
jgi:hypothetical protein